MEPQTLNSEIDEQAMSDRVLGNLSTAILMVDDAMLVVFSNQAAENLLKESFGQMRGKCLSKIFANGFKMSKTGRKK